MVNENQSGLNTKFLPGKKNRYEFFIFLLCVLFAFITWLMIELSKEHTAEVSYPLEYINLEKNNLLISEVPDYISVLITENGYKIARMKYFEKLDTLKIDVNKLKFIQEGKNFKAWARARQILNMNQKQLNGKRVSAIKTDTLFFMFEAIFEKKIKVLPDLNLSFANGFEQADSIIVQPKNVSIKGYQDALNEVESIKTEYKKIKDINSSQKIYLNLTHINNKKIIDIAPDSVKIIIPVKNINSNN